jgi:hypothetical protein
LSFAEQQRQAHRERQKRLGKIPSLRPAVNGPMPSSVSLVSDLIAAAAMERPGGAAVPQIHAVTPPKKETGSNEEWRITSASGVRAVIRVVAKYYSISVRDIVSHRRTRTLIQPRHVAMYLAHEQAKYSFAIIGGVLGRDHTTIMHACRRIADLREQDPELNREIHVLISRIKPGIAD